MLGNIACRHARVLRSKQQLVQKCGISSTAPKQKKSISQALKQSQSNTPVLPFGLKPVDYTQVVPRIYASPPPPPPKPGIQKYFFPFTLVLTGGIIGYFYFNNQNDAYNYWEAMQTGGVLPGTLDDDDDDDDYDDDDYEDEEE
eukprot:207374_1